MKGPANVWDAWLKQMTTPAAIPKRKATVVQFLMSHKDYKDEVEKTYGTRVKESMNQGVRASLRGKIAQEIYDRLDEKNPGNPSPGKR